jgi:hypothetical protein
MIGLLLIRWVRTVQAQEFFEFFNIGIVLVTVGIILIVTAKPTYAVQIGNASGSNSILRSTNLTFIQRIADAMNRAIARRR